MLSYSYTPTSNYIYKMSANDVPHQFEGEMFTIIWYKQLYLTPLLKVKEN